MPTAHQVWAKYVVPGVIWAVIYGICGFYWLLVLGRLAVTLAKGRKGSLRPKRRPVPPPCLLDPALGQHSYLRIKNVSIHYVEAGDKSKPLMLFIHGFPGFWYSWRNQMKEFSNDYWTVAIDLRGYGDSEKPPGVKYYRIKYLVEDIKNIIEGLGREKCTLVAHDWGGVILWYFLQLYPQYVENYVVLNAPHPIVFRKMLLKSWSQFKKSWYIFLFQCPFLPEGFLRYDDLKFLNVALKTAKKEPLLSDEDMEAYKFTFGKPGAFTCPVNYYRANMSPDVRLLKKAADDSKPPPGLLLFGEQDLALEPANVEKTKRIVHNLTTELLPDVGHFCQEEQPEVINKAIRSFLEASAQ